MIASNSNKYYAYFITIYATNRRLDSSYLFYLLFVTFSILKSISVFGFAGISTSSNNPRLRHPHTHILVFTTKRINYSIFLENLVKRSKYHLNVKILPVDDPKKVIEYIGQHEERYIYQNDRIVVYAEDKKNKTKYIYRGRIMGCAKRSSETEIEKRKSNATGIRCDGTSKRWCENMTEPINEQTENNSKYNVEFREVDENSPLYELYFITDVIAQKYGATDYSNYGLRIHIPALLYKSLKTIADYIDVKMTDLVRYLIYKLVQYVEEKNLLKEMEDEIYLRDVVLKNKKGKYRRVKLAKIPVNEFEKMIIETASKILSTKYKYRILDDHGILPKQIYTD